jgi:hypothetical protein
MIVYTPGAGRPGCIPGERPIGYVNGEQIVMDGGEQLKGASEFSHLGDLLTEEQWQMMKPKKKG